MRFKNILLPLPTDLSQRSKRVRCIPGAQPQYRHWIQECLESLAAARAKPGQ